MGGENTDGRLARRWHRAHAGRLLRLPGMGRRRRDRTPGLRPTLCSAVRAHRGDRGVGEAASKRGAASHRPEDLSAVIKAHRPFVHLSAGSGLSRSSEARPEDRICSDRRPNKYVHTVAPPSRNRLRWRPSLPCSRVYGCMRRGPPRAKRRAWPPPMVRRMTTTAWTLTWPRTVVRTAGAPAAWSRRGHEKGASCGHRLRRVITPALARVSPDLRRY